MSHQEESQSTPALIHMPEMVNLTSSLGMIPENTLLESYTRLSVSLEENGLFQVLYTIRERESVLAMNYRKEFETAWQIWHFTGAQSFVE